LLPTRSKQKSPAAIDMMSHLQVQALLVFGEISCCYRLIIKKRFWPQ
jgi:hypothetical protein